MVATTAVVCVVAALTLAFLTYGDVSLAGFPDGHLTEYDEAVATPLWIVTWGSLGLAGLAVGLACSPLRPRARVLGLVAVLATVAVLAVLVWFGIPWYFGVHLGLDNGVGG